MRFLQILTGCRPSRWLPVERLNYVEARVVEILPAYLHPEDHWYVARSDEERYERAMRFIVWRYGIGYDLGTGDWSVERPYRAAADDRPATARIAAQESGFWPGC